MKEEHPTQTTDTSTTIPGWLTGASQYAVGQGENLPQYTPYTGAGYAGLTPQQLQALGISSGAAGQGQGIALGAQPTINQLMGFNAAPVTASSLTPQIQSLLNPATQDVINTTNAQLDKNTAQSMNNTDTALAANHAFGGDRQAVADAVIQNQGNMTKASTDAQLNQGNYNTALAAALQAGQGNQGAAISSAGVQGGAANALSGLGTNIAGLNSQDISNLMNAGGVAQNTNTNQNLFNYQQYLNSFQLPDTQATTLASILGSLPHDTNSTSTTTGTSYSSPLMGLAGLGLGIAGLGTGGGGTLGGMFLSNAFGGH